MEIKDLKIGNCYFIEGLGRSVYMGRFKMDLFIEGESGRKGDRLFKILNLRDGTGLNLCKISKKEIENDVKIIF
jgi:hypothetical protein